MAALLEALIALITTLIEAVVAWLSGGPGRTLAVAIGKGMAMAFLFLLLVTLAGRFEALGFGGTLLTLSFIGVLTLGAAAAWARVMPWTVGEYLIALVPTPVAALLIVSRYSGSTGSEIFHAFNLIYVAQISAVLLLPWTCGTLVGRYWRRDRAAADGDGSTDR